MDFFKQFELGLDINTDTRRYNVLGQRREDIEMEQRAVKSLSQDKYLGIRVSAHTKNFKDNGKVCNSEEHD